MSTEWRHRPSLQALISRKQRKMIIAKSRLMTIAILGAIFGQTKKASPPTPPPKGGVGFVGDVFALYSKACETYAIYKC